MKRTMDKQGSGVVNSGKIESVLIVRLKALGDIVLSFPFVDTLRRLCPEARIDYLCYKGFEQAVEGNGDINNVLVLKRGFIQQLKLMWDLRRRRYDLAVDLISSPRSAVITAFTGAGIRIGMDVGRHNFCYHKVLPRKIFSNGKRVKCYTLASNRILSQMLQMMLEGSWSGGKPAGDLDPPLKGSGYFSEYDQGFPVSEDNQEWADRFLAGFSEGNGKYVGIVPGSKYSSKSWPIENFAALSSMIIERTRYRPVILWGPGEEREADYIRDRADGSLKPPLVGIKRLASLIYRMEAVVGVDSGPKHLAVLQGIPTLTLFGPTDPRIWDPMNITHRIVYGNLDCSPCGRRDCERNVCMLDITSQEVFRELVNLLEGAV